MKKNKKNGIEKGSKLSNLISPKIAIDVLNQQYRYEKHLQDLQALGYFKIIDFKHGDLPENYRSVVEVGGETINMLIEMRFWWQKSTINNDPWDRYQEYRYFRTQSDHEPIKRSSNVWAFKGYNYNIDVSYDYTDDQVRLLIFENFDIEQKKIKEEHRYFESLKAKFDEGTHLTSAYKRPRIPEKTRIEVWRRDDGKCARCGSREKLEYDHIVPISKGGSNTARNIELLCEKCNRSKSNNVV